MTASPKGFFSLRSRSGRTRVFSTRKTIAIFAFFTLCISFFLVLASVYTPLLHRVLGDPYGLNRANHRTLPRKVKQDIHAGFINALLSHSVREKSQIPTYQILVDTHAYQSLNQKILDFGQGLLSSKPKVRAMVKVEDGPWMEADIGYRGTNSWHHQQWKPSLQIDFRREERVNGFSRVYFVAPEDAIGLRNWLSTELAKRLDLLNYLEDFARVFVNGNYMGYYNRIFGFNEELPEKFGLPHGPIFRMEARTGPVFKKELRSKATFLDSTDWEIIGMPIDEGRQILKPLLEYAKHDRLNQYEQEHFNSLFNPQHFARYLAVLCHSAEIHVNWHNFALWFNSATGVFYPLHIDVNGYDWVHSGNLERPLLLALNPYHRLWLQDPKNQHIYILELWKLTQGIGSKENIVQLLDKTWKKIKPELQSDTNTSELGVLNESYSRTLYPVTHLEKNLDQLKVFVKKRIDYIQQKIDSHRLIIKNISDHKFEIQLTGVAAVLAKSKEGKQRQIYPQFDSKNLTSSSVLTLEGQPQQWTFTSLVTGRKIKETLDLQSPSISHKKRSFLVSAETSESNKPILTFQGRVIIKKTRIIKNKRVKIKAGTQFLLHSGQSLIFKNCQVEDNGRESRTSFAPAVSHKQNWGVFAFTNSNVQLGKISVEGGGFAWEEGVSYSGSISVHQSSAKFNKVLLKDSNISSLHSNLVVDELNSESSYSHPVLSRQSSVKLRLQRHKKRPSTHRIENPIGSPPRKEREYKYSIHSSNSSDIDLEHLASLIQRKVESSLLTKKWHAPLHLKVPYRVDPVYGTFLFRDLYFDNSSKINHKRNVSYRLRQRFRSDNSYKRHIKNPRAARDWPSRMEFQVKFDRREMPEGFSHVMESRFEFRPQSPPFSLQKMPPNRPWSLDQFIDLFQAGSYHHQITHPAASVEKLYGASHEQLGFEPSLILLTRRVRLHLNLKNPWGSGPNPEQVFIISLDHSSIFEPKKYFDSIITPSKSPLASLGSFYEMEIEFERNTATKLDLQIEQETKRNSKLHSIRQSFLNDQKALKDLIISELSPHKLEIRPVGQSKYRSAVTLAHSSKEGKE